MRKVKIPGAKPILFGEAPFGWKLNAERSELVLDTDEQRVLSVVRHLYTIDRLPMRGIVDRLKKMNIVNRRGRPFGLSGVWEMIHKRSETPAEAAGRASSRGKKRATRAA
jgi:hypothetical protein